jgi:hypothetical protein
MVHIVYGNRRELHDYARGPVKYNSTVRGAGTNILYKCVQVTFPEKRKITYCHHAVREVDMSTASFLSYLVVQKAIRKEKSRNK